MIDSSFIPLLPYLQTPHTPTLWLADESALTVLQFADITPSANLHIVTNRYDIYQLAVGKALNVEFNDFTLDKLPLPPSKIIYRISKEKSLTHHLFNMAAKLLNGEGELIISGKKNEGIKTYADNLLKTMQAVGKLKKNHLDYYGRFTQLSTHTPLNDQQYSQLHTINTSERLPTSTLPHFYSKPGVFGWNKIDKGTELLLNTLPQIFRDHPHKLSSILDLGCGYGWIFLNLASYIPEDKYNLLTVTATDNNAAAIQCATANAQLSPLNIHVIADDCAIHIDDKFDLILCNPPFHQGFTHSKALTEKFLQQTRRHLKPNGIAVFVINEFIQLPKQHLATFEGSKVIAQAQGFKIVTLY
jgi:16S rRNA (guanine1207-N2)-methyltransferase